MKEFIEVALIVQDWVINALMLKLVGLGQRNAFAQQIIATKITNVIALQVD